MQEYFHPCTPAFRQRIFAESVKKSAPPHNARIIVNPAAGRGRARRALQRITASFAAERITGVVTTECAGDEFRLAQQAIADGIETIVAVGGDGTCSRIAAAIVEAGSSCRVGVVPLGTGNDFAKTLGVLGRSFSEIARLCAGTGIARMDVGVADGIHFLNGCGFGIDPEILATALSVRWLRGNAVYIAAALTKLFSYRGFSVRSETSRSDAAVKMMLTVSNGRNLGGAFKIAPVASVCDGMLDVHIFEDASAAGRLRIFLATMRGRHTSLPEVSHETHSSLELTFDSPPAMEVDGELRQARGARVLVECLPGALSVVAAPGFPL